MDRRSTGRRPIAFHGKRSPAKAMELWKQSPGHWENLLRAPATHVGIGAAGWTHVGKNYFKVVQVFIDDCIPPGRPAAEAPEQGKIASVARMERSGIREIEAGTPVFRCAAYALLGRGELKKRKFMHAKQRLRVQETTVVTAFLPMSQVRPKREIKYGRDALQRGIQRLPSWRGENRPSAEILAKTAGLHWC